jgi:hypothetical protein
MRKLNCAWAACKNILSSLFGPPGGKYRDRFGQRVVARVGLLLVFRDNISIRLSKASPTKNLIPAILQRFHQIGLDRGKAQIPRGLFAPQAINFVGRRILRWFS